MHLDFLSCVSACFLIFCMQLVGVVGLKKMFSFIIRFCLGDCLCLLSCLLFSEYFIGPENYRYFYVAVLLAVFSILSFNMTSTVFRLGCLCLLVPLQCYFPFEIFDFLLYRKLKHVLEQYYR